MPRGRVIVLGARGQLGRALVARLGRRGLAWTRPLADLADPAALEKALRAARPAAVINAAADNDVDGAERNRARALAVNAHGPARLAEMAAGLGFKLVHFSTDYVFGGDGLARPRVEDDPPAPVNFYGYSKLLGEQAVLAASPDSVVLRVAHLYGGDCPPGRENLVLRFLQRARAGAAIRIAVGQQVTPTAVGPLADLALRLAAGPARGLYHAAGAGACELRAFADEVLRLAGVAAAIESGSDVRPAPRARDTRLDNRRLRAEGIDLPPWRDSLRAYIAEIAAFGAAN